MFEITHTPAHTVHAHIVQPVLPSASVLMQTWPFVFCYVMLCMHPHDVSGLFL